jgi:hypothetical protein
MVVAPLLLLLLLNLLSSSASAQVVYDRDALAVVRGLVTDKPLPEKDLSGQQTYANAAWRQKMLAQFPKADADGDGTLTETEAIRYHLGQVRMFTPQGKELFYLPKTVTESTVRPATPACAPSPTIPRTPCRRSRRPPCPPAPSTSRRSRTASTSCASTASPWPNPSK